MLHAVFVRSPVAHARIRGVDFSRAAAAPGVACTLSGADLARLLPPVPDTQLALPKKWARQVRHKFINPQQPLLAHDKVRHVGEALAVIVAQSRHAAEDAAQLVDVDLDPLTPVVDPEAALTADAAIIHDRFQTNLIGAFTIGKGDTEAAFAQLAAPAAPAFLSSPLRRRTDRMPRRGERLRRSHRLHHHLVLDPGRALGSPRGGRGAGPAGSPRALRRPRRRRRLRRQRTCLSGRPPDSLPGAQTGPAGAMDRGPARASDVLLPFARSDSRCRRRLRRRRQNPRPAR